MSLDDLINGSSSNESSAESSKDYTSPDPDGLRDFASVTYQKEKLHNPYLCPDCGEDQTEEKEYYMRCNNDDCETVTYIPVWDRS